MRTVGLVLLVLGVCDAASKFYSRPLRFRYAQQGDDDQLESAASSDREGRVISCARSKVV